jgi:hypothetical protein
LDDRRRFLRNGEPPFFVVMCFNTVMGNDPQDHADMPADDEFADEMLGDVSGGTTPSTMPRR